MNSLAALILLAAAASDGKPLTWTEDLAAACETARREDRLILLRQIVCECDRRKCPYDEMARDPWFAKDEAVHKRIGQFFVPAVTHILPGSNADKLYHPPYAAAGYRLGSSPVRTFFLTSTRHIVHRLDLCPQADDVEAELLFALRVARACYAPNAVPVPGSEDKMFALHLEHSLKPDSGHARGPQPGTRAWRSPPEGIPWVPDLDDARRASRGSGKPILFFQVVGNLDLEGC